jgi:hypothetical protein
MGKKSQALALEVGALGGPGFFPAFGGEQRTYKKKSPGKSGAHFFTKQILPH